MTSVRHFPRIMRAKGWMNGATLMDRWFAGAPAYAPAYGPPDTVTIRMAWALGFQRVRQRYQDAIAGEVWFTPNAKRILVEKLLQDGHFAHQPRTFDYIKSGGYASHPNHIQTQAFKQPDLGAPLDDLTAALANFAFHYVVAGRVEPVAPEMKGTAATGTVSEFAVVRKYLVRVEKVGIYIKDSYDFSDFQVLGVWNTRTGFVGNRLTDVVHGDVIRNGHFRRWRAENRAGGDFLVFSDVLTVQCSPPNEMMYTSPKKVAWKRSEESGTELA